MAVMLMLETIANKPAFVEGVKLNQTQRFRFPLLSRSQTKADAFRFLFLRARQNGLKMRRLFFARDDTDLDFLESGCSWFP